MEYVIKLKEKHFLKIEIGGLEVFLKWIVNLDGLWQIRILLLCVSCFEFWLMFILEFYPWQFYIQTHTTHMWKLYFGIVIDKSKSTFPYCNLAPLHTPKKWSHLETLMMCGWCNAYMLKPSHSIFRHFQHQYWIFLLCRKKNPCLEIQLYGWELD